jgi:hypothetical protein
MERHQEMPQLVPYSESSAMSVQTLLNQNSPERARLIRNQPAHKAFRFEFGDLTDIERGGKFVDWNGYG